MPAIQYPFIDIAVHNAVRDRFARGEALALFSHDLERVLWANGAGAAFFGTASIYDLLEDGPPKQDVTFRQIASMTRQLKANGEKRKLVVRAGSGFRLVPMEAHLERLEIREGEPVTLFSIPVAHADEAAKADAMLRGFDDPDTHMALLDGGGHVIRSSRNFDRLGITPRTADTIVQMAGSHPAGLVKRPIPTARGYLPAAIGKIADAPAIYLLFAVETLLGALDVSEGFAAEPQAEPVVAEKPVADDVAVEEAIVEPPVSAEVLVSETSPDLLIEETSERPTSETAFADVVTALGDIADLEVGPEDISADHVTPMEAQAPEAALEITAPEALQDGETLEPEKLSETLETIVPHDIHADMAEEPVSDDNGAQQAVAAETTVQTSTEAALEHESAEETGSFAFQPTARAVRFVWKIDALGRFSDISPEFASAVGPRAADIEGQTFSDLAALFNLDPDGHITALLTKRDTWSGKTIYWPIEGTSLKVPVDLAALPTYTRNRDFDGFRGFGVVRLADAMEDLDKVGLTFMHSSPPQIETTDAVSVDDESIPDDVVSVDDVEDAEEAAGEIAEEVKAESEEAEPNAASAEMTEDVLPSEPSAPAAPLSDKIIPLSARRPGNRDGLSAGEQAAFREIARKLDALGIKPANVEKPSQYRIEDGEDSVQLEAHNNNTPVTPVADKPAIDESFEKSAEPQKAETVDVPPAPPLTMPDVMTSVRAPAISKRDVTFSPEVLDMLPIALLAHRGDRLIHANPEFLALTGYADLDALDADGGLDALLQPSDMSPEDEGAGTLVAVRADGQHLPVSARLQSIRWEDASALLLALVPQSQITRSQQDVAQADAPEHHGHEAPAEEQAEVIHDDAPLNASLNDAARLRVEVEELRSILETATDGVVTINADGEIRSVNGAASALFNYDEGDIRGKPFVTLFAHESQRAILDYLSGLTGHGVASVLNDGREVIGREASGGFIPLFMAIGRLSSSNGFCAVIRDITQWKRTEEELRNAKRVAETANAHKSDFLARVSHEIRTPLNAIIGFADIMADERFGPIGHSRYAEYSSDIGRSGRHVLDIVNDLLDISKIEAGEMDLDFVSVGLNETVSEAVSLVQPQANAQRVIIRTALSQSVPNVVADLRSIKQIVLNILSNAIRFTPSGGQIIVSTAYESNGSVTLRVRDTGIGMSRSELDQAMKPFRQVSPGGARLRGDGTGLGLPLTKAMADANRASFAIHSTPNEGTLVEITFPSPRVLAG
ncbi:PAS domain-containing sensor histidine kinase [Rhizobium oryziradicis]|uniref:histidine kinase n=1 Tax=Rhizobium oryziradicis TaxID=1867956 RepID=A0A1Q8ZUU6_9HYPH|nr:PAS domain-containing sensor histidine kinase [Rhizobium oryziradicis]OLP45767.1 PAS domain-containing sensor histidine kinase [Rhizobium oryziradicis]